MALDSAIAIEKLYSSEWSRIEATVIRFPDDYDLAEDAAQEVFAAALKD